MKITRRHLRRTIRRVLKESVMGHMDGDINNLIFHAAQVVAEEYGDITVQDVLDTIQSMSDQEIAGLADPSGTRAEAKQDYIDFFVRTVQELSYEEIVEHMFRLVELGELSGGYEDFFEMAA